VGLYIFESTRPYQLRYPREKTPGRIHIPTTATNDALEGGNAYPLPTTAEAETKEEMHAMSQPDLLKASLFQSVAARGGGIRTVRLDEKALTPASRIFLMNLMLVGGGAGGTVSGLRITIFILLLSALFLTRTNTDSSQAPSAVDWKMRRFAALRIAAGVAIALLLLIVLTTLVLAYREAGSFMACLFEATSAVCNNGFSTGMTAGLSIQGKITIILAMLLGRIVPIGLFMRALNSRDIVGKRNDTPGHLLNARPSLRE
jgi:trk system potassium uptake protein TrkH